MNSHVLRLRSRLSLRSRRAIAALLLAVFFVAGGEAQAQVVALVNGAPITEIDIAQRIKFTQITANKSPSRQQTLNELIDEHLKIFICKRYGLEVSESDIDQAFGGMAGRAHLSSQQMAQQLTSRGVSLGTLRQKIRADIGWSQLVRGRYTSTLQVSETEIRNALQARKDDSPEGEGFIYTVFPITFVAPRGDQSLLAEKRREAETLRSQFTSCNEGLKVARAMRGVVVREPMTRNSADLNPTLRAVLNKMEIGHLTAAEVTPQGIEVFALCERRASTADSPARRAAREEIFAKKFEAESKKFLNEVRRQAMIEYK